MKLDDPHDFTNTFKGNSNSKIEINPLNTKKGHCSLCKVLLVIGSFITFVRNTVFNIIFLLMIIAIFAIISFSNSLTKDDNNLLAQSIKAQTVENKNSPVLYLNLNGPIYEAALSDDDYSKFTRQLDETLNQRSTNELLAIERALKNASFDKSIKALYVDVSNLAPTSLDVTARIVKAINKFKDKRKDALTIAYADSYSAASYAIARACNIVVINPFGGFDFKGLSISSLYFKDLFEKLQIDPVVFKAGTFKSAVEPFTNDKMSTLVKVEYQKIVYKLWEEYLKVVGQSSIKTKIALKNLLKDPKTYLDKLSTAQGSEAVLLHHERLVDNVQTKLDVEAFLAKKYQLNIKSLNYSSAFLSYQKYLNTKDNLKKDSEDKIAVIYGIGNIVDTSNDPTAFTPDNIQAQLNPIMEDKSVKAIVLYLNSGGGSVTASEKIRNLLDHVKATKKIPIYVSMNSMCASGAYWIASAGKELYASPSTITGSIGVFSVGFNAHRLLNDYGVYQDGVSTSVLAQNSIATSIPQEQLLMYQMQVQSIYQNFLFLVKKSRHFEDSVDDHSFAQGRIFMAKDAYNLKLVDKIASFNEVLTLVKIKENLDKDCQVLHLTPKDGKNPALLKEIFFSLAYNRLSNDYLKLGLEFLSSFDKKEELKLRVLARSLLDEVKF